MPCPKHVKNCPDRISDDDNKDLIPEIGIDFTTRKPVQTYVINGKNQRVPINECIINLKHLPLTWGLVVEVNGISTRVSGSTPAEVVNNIISLYQMNDVDIDYNTVWYNCNIEWATRVNINNLKASMQSLLAISSAKKVTKVEVVVEPDVHNQGAKLWGGLQAYLVVEDSMFYAECFHSYVRMMKAFLMSDNGCEICADHLDDNLPDLNINRDEARTWVFEMMNKINKLKGKRELTWEEAKRINFWN